MSNTTELLSLITNFPSALHNYVQEDVDIFMDTIRLLFWFLTSSPQAKAIHYSFTNHTSVVYNSFFEPTNCTLGFSDPIIIPGLFKYLSEATPNRAPLFYVAPKSICSNINILDYLNTYSLDYIWFVVTFTLFLVVRKIKQIYYD